MPVGSLDLIEVKIKEAQIYMLKNRLDFIQVTCTSRYHYIFNKLKKKIPWYYRLSPEKYKLKQKEAKRIAAMAVIKLSKHLINRAMEDKKGKKYEKSIACN